jgi:hypothetical protein
MDFDGLIKISTNVTSFHGQSGGVLESHQLKVSETKLECPVYDIPSVLLHNLICKDAFKVQILLQHRA